jgi:hypothetical protein
MITMQRNRHFGNGCFGNQSARMADKDMEKVIMMTGTCPHVTRKKEQ